MVQIVILADDLTGAADAGGAFARQGLSTRLVLDGAAGTPGEDVAAIVRSTGSRGMAAAEAAAVNRQAVADVALRPPGREPLLVYKKIDSLLRGHPHQELRGVMAGLGERRALVAPALPAEGRTTVDGWQRVAGEASTAGVDLLTMFGRDPDLPAARIDLGTIRRGAGAVSRAIGGIDAGLFVADAETDEDLAAIARGALESGIRVLAGSAGLARQLAIVIAHGGRSVAAPVQAEGTGAVLIVAASRHDATIAQVAALETAGIPVVRPSQANLDGHDLVLDEVDRALADHLRHDRPVVLATAGRAPSTQGPAYVARLLAQVVAGLAERGLVGGLVLTGGDVAAAVVDRLGGREIVLGGEVQAAIPWGVLRSVLVPSAPVITKAGSFGEREALCDCLAFLRASDRA